MTGIELLMASTDFQKLLSLSLLSGSIALSACAAPSSPTRGPVSKNVYAGLGIGGSFLQANTSELNLIQDNDSSTAGQLILGLNFNNSFAVEGRVADLGKIEFTDGNELGYQVADISGLYKFSKNKFNAYARAGVGTLFNSGDFETRLDSPVHLVVGAGFGYRFTPRISLRAEWIGHDVDVSHAQASFIYHFDNRAYTPSQSIAKSNSQPHANQAEDIVLNTDPLSDGASNKGVSNEGVSKVERLAKLSVPTIIPVPTTEPATVQPKPEIKTNPLQASRATDASNSVMQSQRVAKPKATANLRNKSTVVSEPVAKPSVKLTEQLAEKPAESVDAEIMQNNSESAVVVVSDIQQAESFGEKQLALADSAQKSYPPEPDLDKDGIIDASDKCPGSENGVAVASDGCSLFSRAVPGLTFWPNTDRLQTSAMTVLDSVASVLKGQPDMQLTVAAYTAQPEDAEAALFLTRRRIIAITRYLTSQGIDATRLRPEVLSNADALASSADSQVEIEQVILTPR